MPLHQSFPTRSIDVFRLRLFHRLKALAASSGQKSFIMPVGIFLVIDKANGGDATAQELVQRFRLLDFESSNVVDFYFLGWEPVDPSISPEVIRFSIESFEECRSALRAAGVGKFGGNADLIFVDAHYAPGEASLDFGQAIRIDLSARGKEKDFPTLGAFLQSLIETAEETKRSAGAEGPGPVFTISDKLAIAIAKESLLDFIFEKWGKLIGAKRMSALAVRNIGPRVLLKDL
jgi:hypothetical protein